MMKRLLTALAIFVLLGIILPGLPILAQPSKTPHENPDRATGSFDGARLLLSYSQITDQANNSQYQSARETLNELEKVDPPEDVRHIIDQYQALNYKLYATLDNLESLLNETNDRLSRNRVDEAGQILDGSEGVIQDAEGLLKDTQAAARGLSEKLGVFAASATDRLSQAYARLRESSDRLADLIARLKSIRQGLNERYNRMTRLTPTALTLYLTPESAFVGDSITATGRLECAGGPLAAKKITFFTDNLSVGSAVTGSDGTYIAGINVPYLYQNNILFTAQYEPSGEDSGVFLAGQSPPVNMSAGCYPTRLNIAVPEMVYCGLPFTLNGEVSTDENNVSRYVRVSLDNLELAAAMVSGRFSFEVTIPQNTMPGRRNLKIAVAPMGRYTGAINKQGVNLSVTTLRIETQVPTTVFLPGTIKVEGKVISGSSPLANAPVIIKLMNSATTVKTAPDGSFSGSIESRSWSPIGFHHVEVTAAIPGNITVTRTVQRQVLTINLLSAVPGLALITWLALVLYRKKRVKTAPEMVTVTPEAVKLPVEVPAASQLSMPGLKCAGIKGRILSAYRSGLAAVEIISGVIMSPSATLREFLRTARLPSPAAAAPFAELTGIAESTLYSAGDPPDIIAARAEALVNIINEELQREPS